MADIVTEEVDLSSVVSGNIEAPAYKEDSENQSAKKLTFREIMTLQFSGVAAAREYMQKVRSNIKPWGDFVNTGNMAKPQNVADAGKRIMQNVTYFQSNYALIFVALVIYCIVTNPLLLIGLCFVSGSCYYISHRGQERKVTVFGRELSAAQQYGLVGLVALPLFFMASAGSTVFWIIGVSFFIIMMHATLFAPEHQITIEEV